MDRPVVNPVLRANPRFQRFWIARLLAHSAQNAILLALLVTVVNETGSTIHSSLLVLTFVIPSALLGVVGGVVADRLPKREVLVTTSLFRAALSVLFIRMGSGVLAIYLTNFAIAAITQVAAPAESATVPSLVPESQLVGATAALNLEVIAAQLLGTVLLAPLLVQTVGLRPLFALTGTSFVAAAWLYARLPMMAPEIRDGEPSLSEPQGTLDIRGAAAAAWTLVRSDPEICSAVLQQTLVATTVVVLISILPVYTRAVLHLSAQYSVAVFSPAAVGMLVALRLVPRLTRKTSKSRLVAIAFAGFVMLLMLLGLTHDLSALMQARLTGKFAAAALSPVGLSALLSAPLGFAYGVVGVAARALLYDRVPIAMQGRVFALLGVAGSIASILPLILVGIMASWLGPEAVLIVVAALDVGAVWLLQRLVSPPRAGRPNEQALDEPFGRPAEGGC